MSNLIERLSRPTLTPYFFTTLSKFNKFQVAAELGITSGYWSNVLHGSKIPSVKLQKKIDDLVLEIEQEVSKS